MNPIAPHGPVSQDPPEYQAPDIEPGAAFDHFLPEQPPADTSASCDDDSPTDPEMSKTSSARTSRGKDTNNAAGNSATPDAAAIAAPLPSLADLRTMMPPVTLSPALTPPTPVKQDNAAAQTGGGSAVLSSLAGVAGSKPAGTTQVGTPSGTSSSPAKIAVGTTLNVPPPAPVSISAAPGTARNATTPAAPDVAAPVSIGDSRLAAPAAEAQAKAADLPVKEAAKIAESNRSEVGSIQSGKQLESELPASQNVATDVQPGGTPVAKDVDVVTNTLSANEKEAEASVPAKRDGSISVVTPASGRGGAGHALVSEMILGAAVTGAATVDAATAQVTTDTASDSAAATQAVKVETLLQNALSVGESVRPDGQGQMEMRVRLNGGAEDVTVRMQVTNDRMQVTFQTDSPELRKALEHGWQQFSATASQTSTLALDQPRYQASGFDAAAGGQSDHPSFSSNQQNSRQQDAGTTFANEPARAAADPQSGFTPTTAAPAAGQSAGRRWSGWA